MGARGKAGFAEVGYKGAGGNRWVLNLAIVV